MNEVMDYREGDPNWEILFGEGYVEVFIEKHKYEYRVASSKAKYPSLAEAVAATSEYVQSNFKFCYSPLVPFTIKVFENWAQKYPQYKEETRTILEAYELERLQKIYNAIHAYEIGDKEQLK